MTTIYDDSTLKSTPLFWKDRYISASFCLFQFYLSEPLFWPMVLGYLQRMVKYNEVSKNSGIFKARKANMQLMH